MHPDVQMKLSDTCVRIMHKVLGLPRDASGGGRYRGPHRVCRWDKEN